MNADVSTDSSSEIADRLNKKKEKFNYYFIGIILATLSLSIQFSPEYGNRFILILFLSWLFVLLSFLLGINYLLQDISLDKSRLLYRLANGNFELDHLEVDKVEKMFMDQIEKMPEYLDLRFKQQLVLYILGITFNCIFIILNLQSF